MEDLILDGLVALSIPTTFFLAYVMWENRKLPSFDDVLLKDGRRGGFEVQGVEGYKTIFELKEEAPKLSDAG